MNNVPIINGNYIQTIAQLLYDMSNEQQQELTVYINNNVTTPPQTIFVTNNPLQIIQPTRIPTNIVYTTTITTPPPIIVNTSMNFLYERICGSLVNNLQGSYQKCMRCVETYVSQTTGSTLSQLTSDGTGCGIKYNTIVPDSNAVNDVTPTNAVHKGGRNGVGGTWFCTNPNLRVYGTRCVPKNKPGNNRCC